MKFIRELMKKHLILPFVGLVFAICSIATPVVPAHAEETSVQGNGAITTDAANLQRSGAEATGATSDTTGGASGQTWGNAAGIEATEGAEANSDKSTGNSEENSSEDNTEKSTAEEAESVCYDQVGAINWLICPGSGALAKAVDAIYGIITNLLTVRPLSTDSSSPSYIVWAYLRDFTNIVFIIMLLVMIYSYITGVGISNYNIKKMLPRIVIAAVLVNLSFIICSLAVDLSNVLGASLRGLFTGVENQIIAGGALSDFQEVSWSALVGVLTGTTAATALGIGLSGGLGQFLWLILGALVAVLLSVFVGLVTIAMRQALIFVLVIIAPLAFVAYLLPNTEKYFKKWGNLFVSMLVFFPLFSVLYGASRLAGWVIIASAGGNAFFVILGMAVQIVPLFMSISLLKMSNTALGAISSKLSGFTAKASQGFRGFTNAQREAARQRHIAHSSAPSASLQRYLDYRAKLRDDNIAENKTTRASLATIRAEGKRRGSTNYDPGAADGEVFKTNHYVRDAATAKIAALEAATAVNDTAHVLGNFGDYHNKTAKDKQFADRAVKAFLENSRSNFTLVNDDEADFNFLTNKYLEAARAGHDSYQYQHYVKAAGGAMGELGGTSVLGQLIAKTAANETRHRHDFAILGNKFNVDKRQFRDMAAGYYNNDDGLATTKPDKNGKRTLIINPETGKPEQQPGEFLTYHPELLVPYEQRDENGLYYNMTDLNGEFVTRVYRNDTPVFKEIISNFDMPINDPYNQLLMQLAGIKEGDERLKKYAGLDTVGLAKYRTTIGKAIQAAKYKEKATFASPMLATSVAHGYIKNIVDLNLARADNLIKTAKAGDFNTQDMFEFKQLSYLMDPEKLTAEGMREFWPEELVMDAQDVNGKYLEGTRLDENGKPMSEKVDHDKATYEELLNTIRFKYLYPLSQRMTDMMARATTQNVIDRQKTGAAEGWGELDDTLQKWNDPKYREMGYPDPYEYKSSTMDRARKIRDMRHLPGQESNVAAAEYMRRSNANGGDAPAENDAPGGHAANGRAASGNASAGNNTNYATDDNRDNDMYLDDNSVESLDRINNYSVQLDIIRIENEYDAYSFSQAVLEYFDSNQSELGPLPYEDFASYVDTHPDATVDELYEVALESLTRLDY